MSVAGEKPASPEPVDAILLKILEAVPFQWTTDGGVEAARQRFRKVPRREVHPEVRSADRVIEGPAGPIPIRVYRPPTEPESALPVVVFIHGSGWSVGDRDLSEMPATLAPARAKRLAALPPAYIAVGGHDPLRDDGVRYAELLAAAGVAVELHNAVTLPHAFVAYEGVVPAATEATARGMAALWKVLHNA